MGITLERAGLQVVEVLGVQRPRSCWSRWFSCSCEALGVISLRGIQQVASILTCPRFDAPWADQTGSTSSPHMRIMRYGSCPLKPAVEEGLSEVRISPVHLRSEEHTSELQSRQYLVCRLLLEKKHV